MISKIFNIFNRKKQHPLNGYSYAVITGAYVGEMLVYIEQDSDEYKFISIPKNVNREVPKDKFELGLNDGIVEVVSKIPKDIYNLLEKQYHFNINKDK
jgi:hypothetical protein